jgi:hypothetical protein
VEIFGPYAGEPPEQFPSNEVMSSFLVEDIDSATAELQAAGVELVCERQAGGSGYFW